MNNSIPSLSSLHDIRQFESEASFDDRVSARSIYDVFVESANKYGKRTALTMILTGADDEEPVRVTYNELLDKITRAAKLFASLAGPRPGVAYMLPNLVETHLTLWGAEAAGYAVPINFLLQPNDIAGLIEASGASVLVALGPHPQLDIWEKAQAVKKILPDLVIVKVAPSAAEGDEAVILFEEGISRHTGEPYSFGKPGQDDDVVAYFHTGGTTGAPKLVTHTHRNQIVAAFGGAALLGLSEFDVMTNGLPLFHVGGCIVSSLSVLMSGANVLILSPAGMRNPHMVKRFWKIVERYKATIIGAVPTALGAVLDVPIDADISSVRYGIVGAASSPRSLGEKFTRLTGRHLHDILGMTEAAGLVSIAPVNAMPVPGSVGLRLPYTEISVRKLDAEGKLGERCAPSEIGVLVVHGPTVSPGYREPSKNGGIFDDGELNSGDLAYVDEDGRLFIAGRAKDLIIRSGHNVDPSMIEDAVCAHPAVNLAAAVGQPDRYAGELPVCYVVLKPGASASSMELKEFAEPRINERPAWPKQIYIIESMPLTSVGKIFKPALRSDAARRLVTENLMQSLPENSFSVEVSLGGKRGMEVTVCLAVNDKTLFRSVSEALEGYLFDYRITVSSH